MSTEWLKMSACDLGKAIESGKIDPCDLTETFIAAIENHSQGGSIFARLTKSRARAEAKAATKRAKEGMRRSILDGVPLSWKDLFDTAGAATEAGSALLAGRTPTKDAEVLRRATALGSVCLGKTHLSELAFSGLGINPVTATPPCINETDAVPGGSSSGAAASVAFGLSSAAIGSDTGGSVRVPAAWNDLVGLKTTSGVLPLEGAVPLSQRFDTIGPLTRNVDDSAAVFSLLRGSARSPILEGVRLNKLRFLILEEGLQGARAKPLEGFWRAIDQLRRTQARLVEGTVPVASSVLDLAGCIYGVETYGQWKESIEAEPEKMFANVRERFQAGRSYLGTDYIEAWKLLKQYRHKFLDATEDYDAALLPTSPIMPPNRDEMLANAEYYKSENLLALRNTRIGNMMELPALTLPTGVPSVGLMILGRPFGEVRLLQLGKAVESALGNS